MESKYISVRGAREHNLKGINVDLPRNELVVITGLSGSGKSSLAFDTIYAEGQRRYVESLSAYARQFLELMQKPEVDSIEGLSPAISIEQKTTSKNPRSTVGTVTEIYDYMRLLFARVGVPISPATGLPIESQTISQMVDLIREMEEGSRLMIVAPLIRGRKGEYKKEILDLQKRGFQRLIVDGEMYLIEEVPTLDKKLKHTIEVVVDRIVVKADMDQQRLADSIETALSLSEGLVYAQDAKSGERRTFSAKFACPVSGFTIDEVEPRLFSFNNPFGACPSCDGLGSTLYFNPELIVPNKSLSLAKGAIVPWSNSTSKYYGQTLKALAKHFGFSLDVPFKELSAKVQKLLMHGSGSEAIAFAYSDGSRAYQTTRAFEGLVPNFDRRYKETDSEWVREELGKYQSKAPCGTCDGYRLKQEARAVKIDGQHVGQVVERSIGEALAWADNLPNVMTAKQYEIGERILKEIRERLGFLNNVGLDYLTLSRSSATLSGGESQRIRLASQIGSGLTGVLYVLDEPSIGLHQRDNERLLTTLTRLRDLGNTVIVVEHDEDAIRQADYLVDIGPGAGVHGGQIEAEGVPEEVIKAGKSLTAKYLSGEAGIAVPDVRRPLQKGRELKVIKASGNNLQDITAAYPLGVLTCVTGVSGSGKSTLTLETLYKALSRHFYGSKDVPLPHEDIEGLELVDKVIDIDQSPIGRTPRSNPATYTGAFGPIRDWFAGLPDSKARGYKPGRFSFNVKGGRCEACQGDGLVKIEMHFLPDVYVQCEQCQGQRYNRETLEVRFKGKSIAEVLDMTVEEGVKFFSAVPTIRSKMEMLDRVGLGYVKIGQSATTLSGGEAQRVKLAKELAKRSTGKTVYILDEPTTGLHFDDVRKLLEVLHELVDQGNTVIVIEHNLEVIKTADHVIDIGPEGGTGGGKIVAKGTPEEVAKVEGSYTGKYLKGCL